MAENSNINPNAKPVENPESRQVKSGSEIREGQENSSILHDDYDEKKELKGPVQKDDRALSQQEFLEDRNNSKKSEDE